MNKKKKEILIGTILGILYFTHICICIAGCDILDYMLTPQLWVLYMFLFALAFQISDNALGYYGFKENYFTLTLLTLVLGILSLIIPEFFRQYYLSHQM